VGECTTTGLGGVLFTVFAAAGVLEKELIDTAAAAAAAVLLLPRRRERDREKGSAPDRLRSTNAPERVEGTRERMESQWAKRQATGGGVAAYKKEEEEEEDGKGVAAI